MRLHRARVRCALMLFVIACGCAHTASTDGPAFGEHGVAHPEASLQSVPWLRERVLASPYTYFRYVNATFVGEVCRRLGDLGANAQRVNLHGDAHVEQFAVTDVGRGLSDFDDSAKGPAAVDLVRFATSLWLVADAQGWSAEAAIDRFFAGYRAALADPTFRAPEPAVVARHRAEFVDDPAAYFARIEEVMEPIDAAEEGRLRAALAPYVAAQRAASSSLSPGYFEVRALGRTRMGIGSARARKYLLRIAGATERPDDDVVLELKEVGDVPPGTCMERAPARDPLRTIVGQARLAYDPYPLTGFVTLDGGPFWVHAWARSYCELSAAEFDTAEVLGEVSFDVGVQLGLGHPRYIAAPYEAETRAIELAALGDVEPRVRALARALATEVTASWVRAKAGR